MEGQPRASDVGGSVDAPMGGSVDTHVTSGSGGGSVSIKVGVRLRPLSDQDKENGSSVMWRCEDKTITQIVPNGMKPASYPFDHTFGETCTTKQAYDAVASRVVRSAMEGKNGSIFAYGQTGSGKTHTVHGSQSEPGFVFHAVSDMFDYVKSTSDSRLFLLRVSAFEIYNENIRDLLQPSDTNLKVHEDVQRGVYVGGLKEYIIQSPEDLIKHAAEAEKCRHVGDTKMNQRSSRSHSILRIVIESQERGSGEGDHTQLSNSSVDKQNGVVRVSTLNLIDLAGSERVGKTGAEGQRLREAGSINKSLLTLATVIGKLGESAHTRGHVPYRDSTLTRILQPALGGNSLTAVICTIHISNIHETETQSTLLFASRTKRVKNNVRVNEIVSEAALLKRLKSQVSALTQELKSRDGAASVEELERALDEKQRAEADKEALVAELEAVKAQKAREEEMMAAKIKLAQNELKFAQSLVTEVGELPANTAASRRTTLGAAGAPCNQVRRARAPVDSWSLAPLELPAHALSRIEGVKEDEQEEKTGDVHIKETHSELCAVIPDMQISDTKALLFHHTFGAEIISVLLSGQSAERECKSLQAKLDSERVASRETEVTLIQMEEDLKAAREEAESSNLRSQRLQEAIDKYELQGGDTLKLQWALEVEQERSKAFDVKCSAALEEAERARAEISRLATEAADERTERREAQRELAELRASVTAERGENATSLRSAQRAVEELKEELAHVRKTASEDAMAAAKSAADSHERAMADITAAREQYDAAQKTVTDLLKQLEASRIRMQELQDSSKADITSLMEKVVTLEEQYTTVKEAKDKLDADIAKYSEPRKGASGKGSSLADAVLRREIAMITGKLKESERVKERLLKEQQAASASAAGAKAKTTDELARANEEMSALKKDNSKLTARVAGLERDKEAKAKDAERMMKKSADIESKLRVAVSEKTAADSARAEKDRELKMLKAHKETMEKELAKLRGAAKVRDTNRAAQTAMEKRLEEVSKELGRAEANYSNTMESLQAAQSENEELQAELAEVRGFHEEAAREVEVLAAAEINYKDENEKLEKMVEDAIEAKDAEAEAAEALGVECEALKERLASLLSEAEDNEKQIKSLRDRVSELESSCEAAAAAASALEEAHDNVRQELESATSKASGLQTLQEQHDNLSNEFQDCKKTNEELLCTVTDLKFKLQEAESIGQENSNLKDTINSLRRAAESEENAKGALVTEAAELELQLSAARREQAEIADQLRLAKEAIEETQRESAEVSKRQNEHIQALQARLEATEAAAGASAEAAAAADQETAAVQQRMHELSAELAAAHAAQADGKLEEERLEREKAELKNAIKDVDQSRNAAELAFNAEREELHTQIQALHADCQGLRVAKAEAEAAAGEITELRDEIDSWQKKYREAKSDGQALRGELEIMKSETDSLREQLVSTEKDLEVKAASELQLRGALMQSESRRKAEEAERAQLQSDLDVQAGLPATPGLGRDAKSLAEVKDKLAEAKEKLAEEKKKRKEQVEKMRTEANRRMLEYRDKKHARMEQLQKILDTQKAENTELRNQLAYMLRTHKAENPEFDDAEVTAAIMKFDQEDAMELMVDTPSAGWPSASKQSLLPPSSVKENDHNGVDSTTRSSTRARGLRVRQ